MESLICPCFIVSSNNILFPWFAGPDKFLLTSLFPNTNFQKVHPPTITARLDFKEYFMTYDNVGSQFVKKKFKAARKKALNPFAARFSQAAYYVPNKSNLCSYAIITGKQDEPVSMSYLRWKDPLFHGMFVIPKLRDSLNRKTCRRFFVVPREQYLRFKKEHKMGISSKNGEMDPVQYFDSTVSKLISTSHPMSYEVNVPHLFHSNAFFIPRWRE